MAIRVTTPEAALAEAARAGGSRVGGEVEAVSIVTDPLRRYKANLKNISTASTLGLGGSFFVKPKYHKVVSNHQNDCTKKQAQKTEAD